MPNTQESDKGAPSPSTFALLFLHDAKEEVVPQVGSQHIYNPFHVYSANFPLQDVA